MSTATQVPTIIIRDIERISEMREVETLQKVVWGCEDLDVVPVTMFIASRQVGGVLVGAYDGSTLAGFVYGFPAYENNQLVHHSHMLAVLPAYRNFNLGYKLKLAQRERVLAQSIKRISWTFDPLQSLNAYFNFGKLGVVADSYKINFYGETTSSFLHQIGTDRLWVTWLIDSQRVCERLQSNDASGQSRTEVERIPSLVRVSNGEPLGYESEGFGAEQIAIEIPGDINALQTKQSDLALRWREATRWAFTMALASGYLVEGFYRFIRNEESVGIYLLSHRRKIEEF
ncbi:MAG TPA: GNAT family N-acetyltransferase [Pyrinomonadaceae bacterium]|nr:GNAT family N-acetyltransferase [Pyrinomonadaceae bacterium]